MIAIGTDSQFQALCEAAGVPRIAADPRYRTNSKRVENRGTLLPVLGPVILSKRRDEWIALGKVHGFPCGPINTIDRVFSDPQVEARELAVPLSSERHGPLRTVANPMRFDAVPALSSLPPPELGDSTNEILGEIGYSTEEIHAMRSDGTL